MAAALLSRTRLGTYRGQRGPPGSITHPREGGAVYHAPIEGGGVYHTPDRGRRGLSRTRITHPMQGSEGSGGLSRTRARAACAPPNRGQRGRRWQGSSGSEGGSSIRVSTCLGELFGEGTDLPPSRGFLCWARQSAIRKALLTFLDFFGEGVGTQSCHMLSHG